MGEIIWREDEGWDKPMVEMKNRERYDDLDKALYKPGLLCNLDGAQLIFVDVSNSWDNLISESAVVRIEAIIDIKNATVNFSDAFLPYLGHITKRCNHNVAQTPPVSVCIGTSRYELEFDPELKTIGFMLCRPLIPAARSGTKPKVLSVCYQPANHTRVPDAYTFPGLGEILNYLMPLFPDKRDLFTYLWNMGNCMLDPVMRPKTLLLCGPGGSGKSKALKMLEVSISGCCGVLPDGSLTGSKDMSDIVAQTVISSRMAICYDVNLETAPLNMSVFKNISGSDTIRLGRVSCKTSCSLTLATNGLVNTLAQPGYFEDSIMRRLMAIEMNVNAMDAPFATDPNEIVPKLDFLCAGLYARLTFDSPPLSPMCVVLTLTMRNYPRAKLLIREETSRPPSTVECVEVLALLSHIMGVLPSEVSRKAKLISPTTVFESEGQYFLKCLVPTV